jgi:hypothetical protein
MRNIKFEDKCIVSRIVGTNEYDEEVTLVIYNGKCTYVESSYSQPQNIMTRSPLVFLPELVLCEVNDSVEVTTKFGRKYQAIIARPREVVLPMTRETLTKLELKQTR